jgi:CRISPR/Cas system-associated exonuclease Cas4 (RecB family)
MKTLDRLKGKIPSVPDDKKSKPEDQGEDLALSLTKAIDKSIEANLDGKFVKHGGFHASTTNECPRFLIYMFRGVYLPSNVSGRLQRIFDNGHAVHSRLYKYFEQMGILIADEVPVNVTLKWKDKYEVPIESTMDGIIDWDGHKIIELKSISDTGFVQRKIFKKPKPEHYRQIQIYLAAADLETGFVIYENKNNQGILIFQIDRDEEFLDKLFKKYAKIHKAYKDGKLPKRYKSPTSDNCKYCSLNEFCWSDADAGVSI